eukprot:gene4064-7353_t
MSLKKLKDALVKRKSANLQMQLNEVKRSQSLLPEEEEEFTLPSPSVLNKRNSLDSCLEITDTDQIMEDPEILSRLFPLNLTLENFSEILVNLFLKNKNEKAIVFSEKTIHSKIYKYCFSSQEFIDCIIQIEEFPKRGTTKINRDLGKLFGELLLQLKFILSVSEYHKDFTDSNLNLYYIKQPELLNKLEYSPFNKNLLFKNFSTMQRLSLLANSPLRIEKMIEAFEASIETSEIIEGDLTYTKTFSGNVAVNWFTEQFNLSNYFAILLAELYRKLRVLKPIRPKATFRDDLQSTFFQIQFVTAKKLIHPLMEYYDDKIDDFDEDEIGLHIGGALTTISGKFGKSNVEKMQDSSKFIKSKSVDISTNMGFMTVGSNLAKKVSQEKSFSKKRSSLFQSMPESESDVTERILDSHSSYTFNKRGSGSDSDNINFKSASLGFNTSNFSSPLAQGILKSRKNDYTDKIELKVIVGTWNVAEEIEANSLSKWLQKDQIDADIYAIGLQEIDMSAVTLIKSQSEVSAAWDIILASSIGIKYVKISSHQLVGLYHCIYIRKELFPSLSTIFVSKLGIGQLGFGNKGGIAIRFNLHESSFCFICAHLAAHQKNIKERNSNYHDIVKDSLFENDLYAPLFHDFVFFYGDLNYRVDLEYDVALSRIAKKEYGYLLKYDQLNVEMKAKNVFEGFIEGEITFPPTYKFDPGTDIYDTSEKKRIPAYCDRILIKSKYEENLKIELSQTCCGIIQSSSGKN